jgi:uncharacterized metal-binding protein YceD (DUF177 family)
MTAPDVELSRPVDLDRIGEKEVAFDVVASPAEREALAHRFGLMSLQRLEARVTLRRTRNRKAIRLAGRLLADVTQSCVVSLEPVPDHIEQEFGLLYGDIAASSDVSVAIDDDDLEPMPDGALDIGEAVAQELALALDPYPRAPGAIVDSPPEDGLEGAEKRTHPFDTLKKLRPQKP